MKPGEHALQSEELEIRMRLADTLLPQLPDNIRAVDLFMAEVLNDRRPTSSPDFGALMDFPEVLILRRLANRGLEPLELQAAEMALSLLARRHFRECRRSGKAMAVRLAIEDGASAAIGVITKESGIAEIEAYTELPHPICERLFEWIICVIKTVPSFIDGVWATPDGNQEFILSEATIPKPGKGERTPYLRTWRKPTQILRQRQ